jgi:OOP family OmpA-OmpF porin
MNRRVNHLLCGMGLICLLIVPGQAQVANGQKVETKGLILTRDGDSFTMQSKDLGNVTVALTEETRVQTPKGMFRHENMEVTSLVPGLDVEVKGAGDPNGKIVAETVRFTKESMKIANQVHAGLTATRAQAEANKQGVEANKQGVEANKQGIESNAGKIATNRADIETAEKRFADLTEFDVKKQLTVNFETGKSDIPEESKQPLIALAKEAVGLKGYLVEVRGFASKSGGDSVNQQLSEDRAEAVVTFLHQQGVRMQNIVNPGAMGTTSPVAENETQEGRLQNQRVEVKVLVNRGLASK